MATTDFFYWNGHLHMTVQWKMQHQHPLSAVTLQDSLLLMHLLILNYFHLLHKESKTVNHRLLPLQFHTSKAAWLDNKQQTCIRRHLHDQHQDGWLSLDKKTRVGVGKEKVRSRMKARSISGEKFSEHKTVSYLKSTLHSQENSMHVTSVKLSQNL